MLTTDDPATDAAGEFSLDGIALSTAAPPSKAPADLEQLFDVPVTVAAILGRARLPVAELLKLGPGSTVELDRRVGEAVEVRVNDRLVARGEVVLVEERLGVTLTEIVLPST